MILYYAENANNASIGAWNLLELPLTLTLTDATKVICLISLYVSANCLHCCKHDDVRAELMPDTKQNARAIHILNSVAILV